MMSPAVAEAQTRLDNPSYHEGVVQFHAKRDELNIGTQLPPRVRPLPLPPNIVRIVPHYRGYEYTIIEDEIVVLEPRTRRVVEIIGEGDRGCQQARQASGS